MKKCYSDNEEIFMFDGLCELFESLNADGTFVVGRVYYEADCKELEAADFTGKWRVESILEQFDEDLYEEVGEVCDNDFSSVDDAAKAELAALLNGWIEKHVSTKRYWKIVDTPVEKRVTADDVAEYAGDEA
jgi:hypothetical protein